MMDRDIDKLDGQDFDLVVVGGGIFGACAACDAAQRGLKVALLERDDFAGATSANSLKMVHGGIRYVQHFDFARIRHSAHERAVMLKIAPHLVRPLPIVIPTSGWMMKSRWALQVGMGIFDAATLDANRGISDPARKIPWCRTVGRDWVTAVLPGLADDPELTGAGVFSDGQMFNPTRLVLAFVQSGVIDHGLVAANHCEVTGFTYAEGEVGAVGAGKAAGGAAVTGVTARDTLTGRDITVRAKVVLNAAGPYAQKLLKRDHAHIELNRRITFSRDTAFVVNRPLTDGKHAVALQGTTSDPDAKLSRGARHMFIAPWRGHTLVGVWHGVHKDDPDNFKVTESELQAYLDEINEIYPEWDLTLDNVTHANAGLVPFGDNPDDASHLEGQDLKYGHRSHLIDHAQEHDIDNLVTLIGVRYTTGRYEADHAVDLVFDKLGRDAPACLTDRTPVHGGDIGTFADHVAAVRERIGERVDAEVAESIAVNYGSAWRELAAMLNQHPDEAEVVAGTRTLLVEGRYAVEREMAMSLSDVVFRRTDLATAAYPGRAALRPMAELVGSLRGWDGDQIERELDAVAAKFPEHVVARVDPARPAIAA
jgi:glycerol-3-phosphate dehydrogenase